MGHLKLLHDFAENRTCELINQVLAVVAVLEGDQSHMADAVGYACLGIAKGLTPWRIGSSGFRLS